MRSYKILEKEEADQIRLLRPPEVRGVDEKNRTIEHIITTSSPDRDGDIIEADGWDLKEFEENPVVLFGHRHDEEPIAKNASLQPIEDGLQALTQFPPEGIHEKADRLFKMNKLGFIRGWSVGFVPKKTRMRFDRDGKYLGTIYEEQTLLEYSLVPIPANRETVTHAISKGLVTAKDLEILGWAKGGLIQAPAIAPEPLLESFSEIIQEEFSTHTNIMALEAESQRIGYAFRKASGTRA